LHERDASETPSCQRPLPCDRSERLTTSAPLGEALTDGYGVFRRLSEPAQTVDHKGGLAFAGHQSLLHIVSLGGRRFFLQLF
jgi:hypothetical protein